MPPESSLRAPSIDLLRSLAAAQGVFPKDADLEAVLGFLDAILPALQDLERRIPPETSPA
jgi:hypothetical protein